MCFLIPMLNIEDKEKSYVVRDDLSDSLESIINRLKFGCSNKCMLRDKPDGVMHTNAGCRCWKEISRTLMDYCIRIEDEVPRTIRGY